MMTIIYNFYVDNFSTYDFNLDSYDNNHIFIVFLRIIVHFSICIYHVTYLIIFKINVSTYWIHVIFYTCIIFVHHNFYLIIFIK